MHFGQPARAVVTHAGHDDAQRVAAGGLGDRAKEHVDGRFVTIDERAVDDFDDVLRAAAFEQHVPPARGDEGAAGDDALAILGFADIDLAKPVEPGGEHGGEFFRHVLDDDHARADRWQGFQDGLQGLCAACRCADGHHAFGGFCHGSGGPGGCLRGQDGIGIQLGRRGGGAGGEVLCVGAGCRADGGDQIAGGVGEKLFHAQTRLGDDAKRTGFEGLQRGFSTLLGQRGADDDGSGPLGHDLSQEADAVHAWHFDVEGDDIGPVLLHLVEREERVSCRADDFDIGFAFEDFPDGLADDGCIVDDHDPDFSGGFGIHGRPERDQDRR